MEQVIGHLYFQRNTNTTKLNRNEFEVPNKFFFSEDRRYVWYTDETKWYSLSSSVFEKFKDAEYRHRFLWAMGHYVDELYPIVGKDTLVVRYKAYLPKLAQHDGTCWQTLVRKEMASAEKELNNLKAQNVSSKNKLYHSLDTYVRLGKGLRKSKKFYVRIIGVSHPLNHIQKKFKTGFKEVDGTSAYSLMSQYGFDADTDIIDKIDINLNSLTVDYAKPHYELIEKSVSGISFFDTKLDKMVSFKYKVLKFSEKKIVEAYPVYLQALKKYLDSGVLVTDGNKIYMTKLSSIPEENIIINTKGKKRLPTITVKECNLFPKLPKFSITPQSYYINPDYRFRIKLNSEINIKFIITEAEPIQHMTMTDTKFSYMPVFRIIVDKITYSLKEEIEFPPMTDQVTKTQPWFLNNWFYTNLAHYADECYDLVLQYFKFKEELSKKVYVDIILSKSTTHNVRQNLLLELVYPKQILKPSNTLETTYPRKKVFTINMDDVYFIPWIATHFLGCGFVPLMCFYVKEKVYCCC
jgi:hypothetical protein